MEYHHFNRSFFIGKILFGKFFSFLDNTLKQGPIIEKVFLKKKQMNFIIPELLDLLIFLKKDITIPLEITKL